MEIEGRAIKGKTDQADAELMGSESQGGDVHAFVYCGLASDSILQVDPLRSHTKYIQNKLHVPCLKKAISTN